MSQPQIGIFAEGSAHHYFLEYDIDPSVSTATVCERLRQAVSAVPEAGDRTPFSVIGFGDALWRSIAGERAPAALRPFTPIQGAGGLAAPATQHALWLWVHGDHHDENFAAAMQFHRGLGDMATLAVEEHGFTFRDSRDLTGFVDGSANPEDDERHAVALVPAGLPGAGGSFVLAQRWTHDLGTFHALTDAEQERVIGRTKPDSVELEGDAMPDDSHVSRTDLKIDGEAMKLYRRSAPIGTVDAHGLYFLGFACDPVRFEVILRSMFGATGDGTHDHLMEFSQADTGSFYFAPSENELQAFLA